MWRYRRDSEVGNTPVHIYTYLMIIYYSFPICRGRMVVGCITTYAVSACHHWRCEFEHRSWRSVLDTTLSDKVFQWLAAGRWFFPGTPVSSTNKTDLHDITEILLKVAINNINFRNPRFVKNDIHVLSIQEQKYVIRVICVFVFLK